MDGPYRATKLWNEMLHTFKHGMPLRRHRRHMRVYENCFSGAEAIQWLLIALKDNPNIKPGITKTQIRQLLSKFMKAGIFCPVCTSNSADAHEFKENEIYQFSTRNLSSILLPGHEVKISTTHFESDLQDPGKLTNAEKIECMLPPKNTSSFRENSTFPSENCVQRNYPSETKTRRKESFSSSEKSRYVVQDLAKNAEKENVFSSQPYFQTSSAPVPPKKPQRRLDSCMSHANPRSASERYDANKNLKIEQKYSQHEARSYSQYSTGSCTHFDRHAHVKGYPCSTHRSPPYESACHVVYNDQMPHQERSSELHNVPYKSISSDTMYTRKTKKENGNENYHHYPPPPYPGNVHSFQRMERRSNYPAVPLKPLHNNVIAMHDAREINGLNSYKSSRREQAGKIFSDSNSQFLSSECNNYNTAKSSVEEKNIKNMNRKLTEMPYVSAAVPSCVNMPTCSETEIWDSWRMVFICRLETVLSGLEEITAQLPSNIRIDWLIRNVQDQGDALPRSSSVDSGLNEWPEDIINNYREQLAGIKEPLIPVDLYNLITEAYLYVEHINNASAQFLCKARDSILASSSVENLVLGMASPCSSDVKRSRYQSQEDAIADSAVYCYETAFASDTPITRIVPQSSLKDVYFSRQNTLSRSFRSSRERIPHDELRLQDTYGNTAYSSQNYPSKLVFRSKSSQDVKDAVNYGNDKPLKEKSQSRLGRRPWRITRKHSEAGQKGSGLQHCRNKSGGYVNPALSQSLEDLSSHKVPTQEFDYVAALESLQSLMRQSHTSLNDKRNERDGLRESTCDLSSESGSYYTAASTPDRQKYSNVSLSKEHYQNKWKQPALGLGISVFQLLLLLISPSRRSLLKRLLRCLHYLPTAINTEEALQVTQSITPHVLKNEHKSDKSLPFRVVRFLVTFYKEVFEIPTDFQGTVAQHLNQKVQAQKLTYCEQVTSKQFEEQGLSASQKALSELLEQILTDSRMGDKEKKRKLKMFKERYPNIYRQHFPDLVDDQIHPEKNRGILQLPSLGKLRNIRI